MPQFNQLFTYLSIGYLWEDLCSGMCVKRSEDSLQEVIFSFTIGFQGLKQARLLGSVAGVFTHEPPRY